MHINMRAQHGWAIARCSSAISVGHGFIFKWNKFQWIRGISWLHLPSSYDTYPSTCSYKYPANFIRPQIFISSDRIHNSCKLCFAFNVNDDDEFLILHAVTYKSFDTAKCSRWFSHWRADYEIQHNTYQFIYLYINGCDILESDGSCYPMGLIVEHTS